MSNTLKKMAQELSPATLSLASSARLGDTEHQLIESLQTDVRQYDDGENIIREGDKLTECYVVRSGWLSRRRANFDGRRIAVNVYLPGDFFAVHLGFNRKALFDVAALEKSEVAVIQADRIAEIVDQYEGIGTALDWSAVRTLNVVSEHVFGLTARTAQERVMHLLLEFWCRLIVVGRATETSFDMPLTQAEIGEIAGLSLVAVNKALQGLRQDGLITFNKPLVQFNDVVACMDYCEFDPGFLEMYEPRGSAKLATYLK